MRRMSQRRRARHAARPRIPFVLAAAILAVAVGGILAWRLELWPAPTEDAAAAPSPSPPMPSPTPATTTTSPPSTPTPAPSPQPANTTFEGITTFAFDISKPLREPPELWSLSLGSCIESTPSVLEGRIWVGTRGGGVYGIAERKG